MPYTVKGKCVYRKDTGKKVGCTKGSVKKYLAALHANVKDVNESEEFGWVDLPETPKDNDFISSVKYALEGSLYNLHLYTTGQLINQDYHLVNLVELRKGNQLLFKKNIEDFTPENVKAEFDHVFNTLKNQKKMLGPEGAFHNPEIFPRLSPNMERIYTLYFGAYELLKDLLPKDINESKEFEWAEESFKELESNPTMVYYKEIQELLKGTEFTISMVESRTGDGIVFRLSKLEGDFNLTIDAWSEKFFKPSSIEDDLLSQINYFEDDVGDSYSAETYRDLYIFLRPFFKKYNTLNESEEWYDEVLTEKPLLRFDDLMVGDVIGLQEHYFHVLSFEDGVTWRDAYQESEKYIICNLVKEDPDTGNFIPISRTDLKFPRGKNIPMWNLIYREGVVESINESEDELEWAKDTIESKPDLTKYLKVGQKFMVKHPLENRHIESEVIRVKERPNFLYSVLYVLPTKMIKPGRTTSLQGTSVTVQRLLQLIEQGIWIPVKESVKESEEDDFGWVEETLEYSFLQYQNKEIMIDIQGLNAKELERLYNIISPYASKRDYYTNDYDEEIIWKDTLRCFRDMIENVSKKGTNTIKSISLHCGIEDNDFKPLKGAVCCLKTTYDDEPSDVKPRIISIKAKDIIGGPINESEWFEETLSEPIMLKVEELEMGDIVIPTIFNQQEYVVTGKGTSVKMLHAPTHWVTLKRNTKENTGGVYIEHDSEIGRSCRFELVYRKDSINESEEDFDWVPDVEGLTNPDGTINFIPPIGTRVEVKTEDENTGEKFIFTGEVIKEITESNNKYFILKIDGGWQQEYGWPCSSDVNFPDMHWDKCWYVYPMITQVNYPDKVKILTMPKNITESEEDSELFWAEDLLKSTQESVDITDKIDIMENLPIGTILRVSGEQDDIWFKNEEVKLVDKGRDKNFPSTYYLFKLKNEYRSDNGELTHCGYNEDMRKVCDCRPATEDDDVSESEVGKCWWIELKNQEVRYYPNRIDLSENQNQKPLLTEGRYDAITRKVVIDIMKAVTEGDSDSYELPLDFSGELEYEQENMAFSLELDIIRTDEVNDFVVDTAVAKGRDNIIIMNIFIGPNFS